MILHDLSAGMHPRRVRIFMAEKGLAIDRREVDAAGGANARPDFLRLNPLGKLPNRWQFVVIWKRCSRCHR
jgi:glutathione S-transferase